MHPLTSSYHYPPPVDMARNSFNPPAISVYTRTRFSHELFETGISYQLTHYFAKLWTVSRLILPEAQFGNLGCAEHPASLCVCHRLFNVALHSGDEEEVFDLRLWRVSGLLYEKKIYA